MNTVSDLGALYYKRVTKKTYWDVSSPVFENWLSCACK